jgi:hydrogenase assembly chaperone HypC/HupF
MCLTIPKKVISIDKSSIIVELPGGARQEVKSIVELKPGDFCLTQQNVAIEKIEAKEASQIIDDLSNIRRDLL